jgi:hypothetical protein
MKIKRSGREIEVKVSNRVYLDKSTIELMQLARLNWKGFITPSDKYEVKQPNGSVLLTFENPMEARRVAKRIRYALQDKYKSLRKDDFRGMDGRYLKPDSTRRRNYSTIEKYFN